MFTTACNFNTYTSSFALAVEIKSQLPFSTQHIYIYIYIYIYTMTPSSATTAVATSTATAPDC